MNLFLYDNGLRRHERVKIISHFTQFFPMQQQRHYTMLIIYLTH